MGNHCTNYPNVYALLLLHIMILLKYLLSEDIHVIENSSALLTCRISNTISRHDKPLLLQWFRSHHHNPIYTLDLRQVTLHDSITYNWLSEGSKHFPSPDFEGRLYLELHSSILSLRIDPVLYQDRGIYTCRMHFRGKRSLSSEVHLQVIVPPRGVFIRDEKGRKVEDVIGPFDLEDTVIITCEAIGGDPLPLVSWKCPYDCSISKSRVNISNNGSTLILSRLKSGDHLSHYSCTANNNNMTKAETKTIILEVYLPPHQINITTNIKEPFLVGQTLLINCESIGAYPRSEIRWYLNGAPIEYKEVVADNGNVTTCYHRRIITGDDDGRSLECVVTHPNLPNYVYKKTYIMMVHYVPKANVNFPNGSNRTVVEGFNFTINCIASTGSSIFPTDWLFEESKLSNSSNVFISNDFIFIQNVKRTQAGNYSCKRTSYVESISSSIYVNVIHPPICQQIEFLGKGWWRGDKADANVTCSLYAHPRDVTFYWMARNSSSNHSWSSGQDSHALVTMEGSSLIELWCWGENGAGVQEKPCTFILPTNTKGKDEKIELFIFLCLMLLLCLVILLVWNRKLQAPDSKNKISQISCQERVHKDSNEGLLNELLVERRMHLRDGLLTNKERRKRRIRSSYF